MSRTYLSLLTLGYKLGYSLTMARARETLKVTKKTLEQIRQMVKWANHAEPQYVLVARIIEAAHAEAELVETMRRRQLKQLAALTVPEGVPVSRKRGKK